MSNKEVLPVFQLSIQHHQRVWGGQNLANTAAGQVPIGEAWLVHEHNKVLGGSHDGQTLASLSDTYGEALVGAAAFARTGKRFPLLIKILDCADWLSIQVHPNDAQAKKLVGLGEFGKTEAWHVLQCKENAELIAGVKPGTTQAELENAIRSGAVREVSEVQKVFAGDTVMMHAGTMHALGPGMLIYEVQQTSDTTYRVYDWDRPASAGRALHLDESVQVTTTELAPVLPLPKLKEQSTASLASCQYFHLEILVGNHKEIFSDTQNKSFHAITVSEGQAQLKTVSRTLSLNKFDTVIVPASFGEYLLQGNFKALRSSAP